MTALTIIDNDKNKRRKRCKTSAKATVPKYTKNQINIYTHTTVVIAHRYMSERENSRGQPR